MIPVFRIIDDIAEADLFQGIRKVSLPRQHTYSIERFFR